MAQAQIIYVSDNRSVSADLGLNTNSLSEGGLNSVTYSGDYSGSASPSVPFAGFNGDASGGVNATTVFRNVTTNNYSGSVYAIQDSSLGLQGITYSSGVSENDNFPNLTFYSRVGESSYLQVSFMVATATPYSLSCTIPYENDPEFSSETWTLASANLGNLVTGPPTMGNIAGTFNYSGMFTPGDVYTLTLQEHASQHGGQPIVQGEVGFLDVSLAIPEPKSSLLLGMGMLGLVAIRHRRKSKALEAD